MSSLLLVLPVVLPLLAVLRKGPDICRLVMRLPESLFKRSDGVLT